MTEDDLKAFLNTRIGSVTLVYVNSILIGSFVMDVYKNSVELHGIVRPDLNKLVPNPKRIKAYVMRLIFNDIFLHMGKVKVFIKSELSNKGVRGFAMLYNFTRLPNQDKKRTVWVLNRQDYFKRFTRRAKDEQGTEERTTEYSAIPV